MDDHDNPTKYTRDIHTCTSPHMAIQVNACNRQLLHRCRSQPLSSKRGTAGARWDKTGVGLLFSHLSQPVTRITTKPGTIHNNADG